MKFKNVQTWRHEDLDHKNREVINITYYNSKSSYAHNWLPQWQKSSSITDADCPDIVTY